MESESTYNSRSFTADRISPLDTSKENYHMHNERQNSFFHQQDNITLGKCLAKYVSLIN